MGVGGMICEYCKQEMLTANGCTWTHIKKKRGSKHYLRDTDNITGELRCHDCGAIKGFPHHPGCDNERCVFCGGQSITCNCRDLVLAKGSLLNKQSKK
jgi:hypothetical protein